LGVVESVELRIYEGRNSRAPFSAWLDGQKDKRLVAIVFARLNRIRLGNLGDCRPVGEGVSELRIDYGPGYRIYFGRLGNRAVLLLCAGSKRTQTQDIASAQRYWRNFIDDQD
jgi:putative addiction module killer protein